MRVTRHYVKQLDRLSQVCTLWANLVQQSPSLWAHIRLPRPGTECAKSLTLSGDHPLTVDMDSIYTFSRANWTAVAQHIHRWQSAVLYFSEAEEQEQEEVLVALRGHAPIIRSLELSFLSESPVKPLDLFGGYAPDLSRLELFHVALERWDGVIVSGLRYLHLQGIPQSGPSLRQMICILGACPELQELYIINVNLHYDTPIGSVPSIPLLRLRTLYLVGLARDHMVSLLAAIQTPYCTKFDLQSLTSSDPQAHPNLLPNVASLVSQPFNTSLLSTGRLTIRPESPGNFFLICTAPDTDLDINTAAFSLNLGNIAPGTAITNWVANVLDRNKAAMSHLDVRITCLGLDGENHHLNTLTAFRRIPAITTLNLFHYDVDAMDTILRGLSSPTSPGPGAPSWLCPKLRAIFLWRCVSSDAKLLVRLVEARAEGFTAREGDGTEVGGYEVLPIEELHVQESDTLLDEEAFATIQALLGDKAVWVLRHGRSGRLNPV